MSSCGLQSPYTVPRTRLAHTGPAGYPSDADGLRLCADERHLVVEESVDAAAARAMMFEVDHADMPSDAGKPDDTASSDGQQDAHRS